MAHWRTLAANIPDDALRTDAQTAIDHKRANVDGAALFWTLPRTRSPVLLRLLVAYEILADYLDCASERGAYVGVTNGLQLHRALVDALDPTVELGDYYKHHPWSRDDGYLYALIQTCRDACLRLPSYQAIKPLALRAAGLTQVLGINHEPDLELRDTSLQAWAATHLPNPADLAWWERTGAASAWLTVLALLALAAEPAATHHAGRGVYAAYLPWVSLAGTMLDSYGDLAEDAVAGDHSYISHYPNTAVASQRLAELVERSLTETRGLRNRERHLVIVTCMIAMYLTKDSARDAARQTTTTEITRAGGSLTRWLVPILRAWRVLYKQQTT